MPYYYLEYDAEETAADNNPRMNLYNPFKVFNTYNAMIEYIENHPFGLGSLIPVQIDPNTNVTQYIFVKREKLITKLKYGVIKYSIVLVGDKSFPLKEIVIEIHSIDEFYKAIWNIDRLRCFNAILQYGLSVKKDLPWVENEDYFSSHIPESDAMEFRYIDIDYFSLTLKGTNFGDIDEKYEIDYNESYGIFKLFALICAKFYDVYMVDTGEEIGLSEEDRFWWIKDPEGFSYDETVTYPTAANTKVIIDINDFLLINDYLDAASYAKDSTSSGIFIYYKKSPLFMMEFDLLPETFFPCIMDIYYYIDILFLYCKLHLEDIRGIIVDPSEFTFEIRIGSKKIVRFIDHITLMEERRSILAEVIGFILHLHEEGEI